MLHGSMKKTILLLMIIQTSSNSELTTWSLKKLNETEHSDDNDDDEEDEGVDVEMIVIILVYGITFLLGSVGNALVIVGIARFKKMHTVTNIFLVSLASADLLLILTCIPFKVGKTFSYVWRLGEFICKFGHYIQNLSVICSVLTLTVISIERYYAILKPIQSRFICTKSRAKKMVITIWIVSLIFAIPILIGQVHLAVGPLKNFYWCKKHWSERLYAQIYEVFMLLLIVIIPLSVMLFTYSSVSKELWNVMSTRSSMTAASQMESQHSERRHVDIRDVTSEDTSAETLIMTDTKKRIKTCDQESADDIRTKKQVVKMLVIIVVLFAICWIPITVENLLKAFDLAEDLSFGWRKHMRQAFDLMSYFNSCVNPIVYAFMSKNFRQTFMSAVNLHYCKKKRRGVGSVPCHSRSKLTVSPYAVSPQPAKLQESTCLQGASVETMVINVPQSVVLNGR